MYETWVNIDVTLQAVTQGGTLIMGQAPAFMVELQPEPGFSLQLAQLLLGHHHVLQALALWLPQSLRMVDVQNSPDVCQALCNADYGMAYFFHRWGIIIRHGKPVSDVDPLEFQAVVDADSTDLGEKVMIWNVKC